MESVSKFQPTAFNSSHMKASQYNTDQKIKKGKDPRCSSGESKAPNSLYLSALASAPGWLLVSTRF